MIMPPNLTSSMVEVTTKSINSDSSPCMSNPSPSCLKWAESFDNLIQDSEGVNLFRKFLEQEGCAGSLDFWFACQGFKLNIDPADHQKAQRLIRVIYKSFIHGDANKRSMGISSETRRVISNYLHSSSASVDMNIFDKAQDEVEELLRTSLYPGFLHSDLYVQWIQKLTSHSCSGKDSPDSIEDSSPSLSDKLIGGLQTLDENLEFQMDEETVSAALTSANLLVTCHHRIHQSYKKRSSQEKMPHSNYRHDPLMNPYHVSYAPVSTRDSELQSLSSSQFTDETRSKTTDSSRCDSCNPTSGKWSHINNYSCHSTTYNRESGQSLQPVIPRTHFDNQAMKRNLAERDPDAFACELIVRLESVARDQLHQSKIESLTKQHKVVDSPASSSILTSLASRLGTCDPHEADAQTILEEHCSRIWANSTQGSPPSDAAETGSPEQHYSHHHHHIHHYKHRSSSRRSRHHAGSTADSASICTVGVDSGVSLPTVISSNSSNSASIIQNNKSQSFSSNQFYQQTQQTSDKVLAWIFDNRESQTQRSTHRNSTKPSRSSHLNSSMSTASPRSKSLCREEQSSEPGLVIGYYLSGDNVPFRCQWPQSTITLGQFKNLISRKCNYRFFFKQVCHDFESEVVYEELSNDDALVPLYQGKVVAKVMRID